MEFAVDETLRSGPLDAFTSQCCNWKSVKSADWDAHCIVTRETSLQTGVNLLVLTVSPWSR